MAAQARGFFQELLLGYESTYGTSPASGSYVKVPFNSIGLGSDEEFIDSGTIDGNRFTVEPILGNISVGGSISVPVDVRNFPYWLKALFGTPATSGSGPTYTHVFYPQNDSVSMTLERGLTDISRYHLFNGCKINSFSFEFAKGQELVCNMEILGKGEVYGTTTIDGAPSAAVFQRFNAKQVSVEEGGGVTTDVKDLTIDVSNDLDGDVYTLDGSGFRDSLPDTSFMVNGNYSALYKDSTFYTKMINNTETSLTVTTDDGTNSIVISIPECKYPRKSPEDNAAGPIYLPVEFKAYKQDESDAPLTITVVNDVASY